MTNNYIVKYSTQSKRIIGAPNKVDTDSSFESLWDNADIRMEGKGPLVGMAYWEPDLWFMYVQAESEELAEKIALDWVRWRNNE
jgi:hypothetical protein